MQNILISLSGWQLFIKQKYPHLDIQSVHGFPGFKHTVEFEGKAILCSNAFVVFDSKYFEIQGHNKNSHEFEVYSDTLSYKEMELIRKLIRADLLNRIDFVSRFLKVSFSFKTSIEEYMKGGFLAYSFK